MSRRDSITEPKKAIDLSTWPGKMQMAFPDPLRRRGWVHVIWCDPSKTVRNYLAQPDGNSLHVEQAGPGGQTFTLPEKMSGMAWDRHHFPTGVWVGNEPSLVPMDPGLKISAMQAGDVSNAIKRAIRVRAASGNAWEQMKPVVFGFMVLLGIGLAFALAMGSLEPIINKGG